VPIFQDDVFETDVSSKPRDKIIDYTVQKGDTISSIAKRFGISEDTIRWANDLRTDNITVGDTLKILPVTGIAHKVEPGDTVYSIAKKYSANPQTIVDFPFNEFANPQVFSLVVGQIIIVPDGVKPQEAPRYARPRYIATGPVSVSVAGFTWPLQGTISQLFSWYHQGIDIAASYGAPIVAAQSGVVKEVHSGGWNWGYGVYVVVAGTNGYDTRYAHMSGVNVAVGQEVVAGKTIIGWVGLTGRTTGPHLHFEIFNPSGGFLNPLSLLR
jgi:murein DD-endopeptidase MepM/ murein hydrolase activator NlpD